MAENVLKLVHDSCKICYARAETLLEKAENFTMRIVKNLKNVGSVVFRDFQIFTNLEELGNFEQLCHSPPYFKS